MAHFWSDTTTYIGMILQNWIPSFIIFHIIIGWKTQFLHQHLFISYETHRIHTTRQPCQLNNWHLIVFWTTWRRAGPYPVILHPHGGRYCGAYHCVEVDQQTAFLRLMHYFHDPPTCNSPRIFKRDRQAFGDPEAAIGLKILCINFVAAVCILAVSHFLIESIRYADNFNVSFKILKEY